MYDGDTIWAAVIVQDKAWRINCRILGLDTPEMPNRCCDVEFPEADVGKLINNTGISEGCSISALLFQPFPALVQSFRGFGRSRRIFRTRFSREVVDRHYG